MTTSARRRAAWDALSGETFDLLVIGGGITGAGVARDAVLRGLRVALVDKSDFGAGTSSKSSKLIHGGLRYLRNAEFGLVFEAVNERTRLLRLAPHLVRPLSFLMPAYKGQFPGLFFLDCGLWIYDALSKFASPRRHLTYRARRILDMEPGLSGAGLRGGIVYYDSMTDDARLTLENVLDARAHGAVVASYARVTGFLRGDGGGEAPGGAVTGAVAGAMIDDVLSPGEKVTVRARVTVNATGPWSDGILSLTGPEEGEATGPLLRPTKGAHVVVDRRRLPVRHAVVMIDPKDERVLFAIPWGDTDLGSPAGRTVIGTTDTDYHGDLDQVAASKSDVDYLLSCANHYFPEAALGPGDVLATWAGLRPLVAPPRKATRESAISREHRLLSQPGLLTIAGGKLTTYRRMAAQVVDTALGQLGKDPHELPCPTADAPLPGAQGLTGNGVPGVELALSSLGQPGIDAQVARHLAHIYGSRALEVVRLLTEGAPGGDERLDAELPYIMAEVDLAVTQEEALRLDDVLARRLKLLLWARDQGLGCAGRVARRMGEHLGWSDEQQRAEVERYGRIVELSRQFRREG